MVLWAGGRAQPVLWPAFLAAHAAEAEAVHSTSRRFAQRSALAPAPSHSAGASVSLSGVTVLALDPWHLTLEMQPALSLDDAWAVIAALAPTPPLLLHRQPGADVVRGCWPWQRGFLNMPHRLFGALATHPTPSHELKRLCKCVVPRQTPQLRSRLWSGNLSAAHAV